jgi:Uma2 family endonuclease
MRKRPEKYTPQYTYSEWLHWEERGELIKGLPVAKASRIGPKHEKAVLAFKTALTTALNEADCKDCSVGEPIDYKISNDIILRPDVFIVCGKINKSYLDYPAALVVEVVSKVSEERDRGIKFQSYEQHGVKYYLLADAMKKSIEIYQLTEGKYELQEYQSDYKFQLSKDCKIIVDFDTLWV